MILVAIKVILKVKSRSQNTFAYTLMSLTVLMGVAYVGEALTDIFRNEVVIEG